MNWIFKVLLGLFVIYISLTIAIETGYYEAKLNKKTVITQEGIKQFEQDKVILEESEVKTINYQFYNSADIDLNSITFEKITFNYNIDNQNDNSLNINLR